MSDESLETPLHGAQPPKQPWTWAESHINHNNWGWVQRRRAVAEAALQAGSDSGDDEAESESPKEPWTWKTSRLNPWNEERTAARSAAAAKRLQAGSEHESLLSKPRKKPPQSGIPRKYSLLAIFAGLIAVGMIVLAALPEKVLLHTVFEWASSITPLLFFGGLALLTTTITLRRLHAVLSSLVHKEDSSSLGYRWSKLTWERYAAATAIILGVFAILTAVVAPIFFPKVATFMSGALFKGTFLAMNIDTAFVIAGALVAGLATVIHVSRLIAAQKAVAMDSAKRPSIAKFGLMHFFVQLKGVGFLRSGAFAFFGAIVPATLLSLAYKLPAFHAVLASPALLGMSGLTLLTGLTVIFTAVVWLTYLRSVLAVQLEFKSKNYVVKSALPEVEEPKSDARAKPAAVDKLEKETNKVLGQLMAQMQKMQKRGVELPAHRVDAGGDVVQQQLADLNDLSGSLRRWAGRVLRAGRALQAGGESVISAARAQAVDSVATVRNSLDTFDVADKIRLSNIERTLQLEQIAALQALQGLQDLDLRGVDNAAALLNDRAKQLRDLFKQASPVVKPCSVVEEGKALEALRQLEVKLQKKGRLMDDARLGELEQLLLGDGNRETALGNLGRGVAQTQQRIAAIRQANVLADPRKKYKLGQIEKGLRLKERAAYVQVCNVLEDGENALEPAARREKEKEKIQLLKALTRLTSQQADTLVVELTRLEDFVSEVLEDEEKLALPATQYRRLQELLDGTDAVFLDSQRREGVVVGSADGKQDEEGRERQASVEDRLDAQKKQVGRLFGEAQQIADAADRRLRNLGWMLDGDNGKYSGATIVQADPSQQSQLREFRQAYLAQREAIISIRGNVCGEWQQTFSSVQRCGHNAELESQISQAQAINTLATEIDSQVQKILRARDEITLLESPQAERRGSVAENSLAQPSVGRERRDSLDSARALVGVKKLEDRQRRPSQDAKVNLSVFRA